MGWLASRDVADQKPPRLSGDERATLLALLGYQRSSFVRTVTGVSEKDASFSLVGSGTSLLWLANHVADAEITWVLRRFAQRENVSLDAPAGTLAGAVDRYEQVSRHADEVINAAGGLDVVCPSFDEGPPVNLRWVLAHLLEETARHAGHADIIREAIDGTTGR